MPRGTTLQSRLLAVVRNFAFLAMWATCASAETHIVQLIDFEYVPKDISIKEGDTIRWVWDTDNHNVVSGIPFNGNGVFSSTVENTGFEFEVRFSRELLNEYRHLGTVFEYFCTPHATDDMFGSVNVLREAKQFAAQARGFQLFPPNASSGSSDCEITLNAEETMISVSCMHSAVTPMALAVYQAPLGRSGALVCTGNANGAAFHCTLSDEQVDALYAGELYIRVDTDLYPTGELRGQVFRQGGTGGIQGTVYAQDAVAESGVTISNGSLSVVSDADGNFSLSGLANGVYQLDASKPGRHFIPLRTTSPILVNGAALIHRDFEESPAGVCGPDSDRDSICDSEEFHLGTATDDRGSRPDLLQERNYLPWNSFIEIINIAEFINTADVPVSIQYALLTSQGNRAFEATLTLQANEQRDILLHELPGYELHSYGLFEVVIAPQYLSMVQGRMMYYRPSGIDDFSFVFASPLTRALYGPSYVSFNTFQPSRKANESSNVVAQWLTIANLDPHTQRAFNVRKYLQDGSLLSSSTVQVAALGRIDLEAGHVHPGPNAVGLIAIEPHNRISPYLSFLNRYGGNAAPGAPPSDYLFGFSLPALPGAGVKRSVPVSRGAGAENWVEIANVENATVAVLAELRAGSGELRAVFELSLLPFAQQHIDASGLLSPGETGSMSLTPNRKNSLITQSMFYFRDALDGSIDAMYGAGAKEAYRSLQGGTYNRFLGMSNWLRLNNPHNVEQLFGISVFPPGRAPVLRSYRIPPFASLDLDLHNAASFGTAPDEFGVIRVEAELPFTADILRLRSGSRRAIDFVAPTAVR